MKIKLRQVGQFFALLRQLDGYTRVVSAPGAPLQLSLEPYSFNEQFTWDKVKDLKILRRKLEEIEELMSTLVKKHNNGEALPPDDKRTDEQKAAAAAAQKEIEKALDIEEEIPGLLRFKRAEFNLYDREKNPKGNVIASTLLLDLEPFIEEG
jgi:hypothetical protein